MVSPPIMMNLRTFPPGLQRGAESWLISSLLDNNVVTLQHADDDVGCRQSMMTQAYYIFPEAAHCFQIHFVWTVDTTSVVWRQVLHVVGASIVNISSVIIHNI